MHGGDVKQTRPAGMKTDRSRGSVKLKKTMNQSTFCGRVRELTFGSRSLACGKSPDSPAANSLPLPPAPTLKK